jgi:hypothetical protein
LSLVRDRRGLRFEESTKSMEEMMNSQRKWLWAIAGLSLSVIFTAYVYGHEGGGTSSKNLVQVALTPTPSVPEFANAKGTVAVDLSQGIIRIEDLEGFPINPTKNLPLTINVTSTTDPRSKGHNGEPGGTSCSPANSHAQSGGEGGESNVEAEGPWTCHVHSYVVWLAGFEDGALGHVIPLGTIYPRTDGSAADRDFSAREGDMSGLGANTIIITAEVSFGPLVSTGLGHSGETSILMVPRGPIVLQATLP